jgi:hypothetical protein
MMIWLNARHKEQRKFRNAVLIRLSNIESRLTEVHGTQLDREAKNWPLNQLNEDQLTKYFQDVDERISSRSLQLGQKMVRCIYGSSDEVTMPHD